MQKLTILIIKIAFILASLSIIHETKANNWDDIFDYTQYQNAKISPDGEHLAVSVLIEDKRSIVFLDSETMKVVGNIRFPGKYEAGNYFWVNDERVVIKLVQKRGWLEQLTYYGELFAVNLDGKKGSMIYGYRAGEMQTGSRLKKKRSTAGWAEIVDILPDDEEHILISSTPMGNSGENLARLHRLNVYSGVMKNKSAQSPVPYSTFITDSEGQLRAVSGVDLNDKNRLYLRKNKKWEEVSSDIVSSNVQGIAIDPTGEFLYTVDNKDQNTKGLFKLNLKDKSYQSVFSDKNVDVNDLIMSTQGNQAYAVRLEDGYTSYVLLDKKNEEAKVYKAMLQAFPYHSVDITSRTKDGNMYIVSVSSDVEAGKIFLFDRKKNSMKFLFKSMPKFKAKQFAQVEPIKFKSKDGHNIHGYFTPAKGLNKEEIAPVVVLVHGGPHGIRDYWQFDKEAQYLALNGYSVLQVNFRGSGGYGRDYELAGHRAWGTTAQQDIYDGVQWLIQQKKADESKVCIMGTSFGAYSAVQSAAIYPDTYKCAVANAGIYDLELLFEEGDIQEREMGISYLQEVLGTDEELLQSMSPVHYVEKIKAPILLAHGEEDKRAPFEHAEKLSAALDKANKPYEWFAIDKEAHGFFNPENQKAYMRKVVKFLDQHIR
jgi:dipeptidyl aminopeptidase/acylaminoacyl peptidase